MNAPFGVLADLADLAEPADDDGWPDEPRFGCESDGPITREVPIVPASAVPDEFPPVCLPSIPAVVAVAEGVGAVVERVLLRLLLPLFVLAVVAAGLRAVPWSDITSLVRTVGDGVSTATHDTAPLLNPSGDTVVSDVAASQDSSSPEPPTPTPTPTTSATTAVPAEPVARGSAEDVAPSLGSSRENQPPTLRSPSPTNGVISVALPTITHEIVSELKPGMTVDQVTAVVGVEGWDHAPGFSEGPISPRDPATRQLLAGEPDESRWTLRAWPSPYFGPVGLSVLFHDGRAVEIDGG